MEQLKHNNLDLIYVSKSKNSDPDLKCYYARKESSVFVSATDYEKISGKSIAEENIFKHNFIVTEREGMYYSTLSKLAAEKNTTVNDWIEVDNVIVIMELVKKGLGIGFLPEYLVYDEIKAGNLKEIKVDEISEAYYSQIICHKDRWVTPFMLELINILKTTRPENN